MEYLEPIPVQLPMLLSISNILLCISFIVHFLIKYRNTTNKGFIFSWISFWATLAIVYCISTYYRLNYDNYSFANVRVVNLLNLTNSILLGVSSEYFNKNRTTKWRLLAWIAIFLLHVILIFSISQKSADVFISYLCFISMAIYTNRFFNAVNGKRELISLFLVLYSGCNLLFPLINRDLPIKYYLLITSIVLPLKFALYLSGYIYLATMNTQVATEAAIEGNSVSVNRNMPDPTIEVSLTGIWGFLYMMWKYPSGKFVVYVAVISLCLGITFIVSNLVALKDLFKLITIK